jgi:hypothetical protein
LLSIFYVKKREEAKAKEKDGQGSQERRKKRRERKERYLCSQVSIYFQDSEERSYF